MEKIAKYTLEEAYKEIHKIREEMGYSEFKSKEEQTSYERGYQQAIIDMTTDFKKRSLMLLAINTTKLPY